ncbi:MAG: 3-keto-5-aminohexanoate cleavage protein [Clostridiales Family XIII bacterium]|jgi:3-keto-5-aminohexanoate cleavage enzyme|nr:3-keto-5-aminohexanoate cleavage protein [Clostridiales Family XIII bacterium]
MSNQNNKVNWDYVKQMGEQYGFKSVALPMGGTEIADPTHSAFLSKDVDIQPKWNTPEKVIISSAVTGGFHSKNNNPNHPVTMDEITQSARECCQAGSPIVHVHARNEQGRSTLSPELLHKIIDPLREEFPDTVFDGCLVPYSATDWENMTQIIKDRLLDVTPINTTATFTGDLLFTKLPHAMIEKTRLCQQYGVKPQIAVYSDGDIDNADRYLVKSGLLEKPYHFLILPALPGCSPMPNAKGMAEGLLHLYNRIMDIDKGASVMVCAAGRASSYLSTLALLLGLDIRVGMEDTVWKWPHKDDKIENNAAQFKTAKTIAELLGRELGSPDDYRKKVGIS